MEIHPRTKTLATELLTRLEGCETTAYLDPVGVPTICTGLTRYPNGEPVRLEDVCHEDICGKYTEQLVAEKSYLHYVVFLVGVTSELLGNQS